MSTWREGMPTAEEVRAHMPRGGLWVIDQDGPFIRRIYIGKHGGPEMHKDTPMLPVSWADARFWPIEAPWSEARKPRLPIRLKRRKAGAKRRNKGER